MSRKLLLIILSLYILCLPLLSYFLKDYMAILAIFFLGLIYIGYYFWRFLGAVVTASLSSGIVIIDYFLYDTNEVFVYLVVGTSMLINIFFGIKVLVNDVFYDNGILLSETMGELNDAREQFRILTRATKDAIIIVNDKGQINYWNESAHQMFGYQRDEILNKPWYILVNQHKYYDAFLEGIKKFKETGESSGVVDILEICAVDKLGKEIPVEITISAILLKDRWNAVVVLRDITERLMAEENINRLAYYDTLTELPNRVRFNIISTQLIEQSVDTGHCFAIMVMDLNQFKTINDSLGHEIGDLLLKKVAMRLRDNFILEDTVFRLGGDEFAIIITSPANETDVERYAEAVLSIFEKPFDVKGLSIFSSISIGLSMYPKDGNDIVTLVRNADTAMYRAKSYGHSKFKFYTDEMHQLEFEKLSLYNNLQLALKNEEFELYYQPQVEINSYKVVGLEALIRWKHPQHGMVPPIKFIPIAEETGAIIEIGKWVLRSVCQQFIVWKQMGYEPMPIAINISMKEFQSTNFTETVANIIDEFKIDPNYLEFEITESIAMFDASYVITTLNRLKDLGISVSIDDFGMGFSSLNILKSLPIDQLKIDRTFIKDISVDEDDVAIVETFISLAKKLKLSVVAEGVETAEQKAFLEERKCDLIQGYLFSPPLQHHEVEKYLSKRESTG